MSKTKREKQLLAKFRFLRSMIERGGSLEEIRFDPFGFGYHCGHVAHLLAGRRLGTHEERRHHLFQGVWPRLSGAHVRDRFEKLLTIAREAASGPEREACEFGLSMLLAAPEQFVWTEIFFELVFEVQFMELADACERLEILKLAYDQAADAEAVATVRAEMKTLVEASPLLFGALEADREIHEPERAAELPS